MAKQDILLGVTDRTFLVFIPDPASTDGSGKTGLNAAALTVSYTRVETDNDVVVTDATGSLSDLSALTDAHADWGLKEVSSTLAPGLYRLDVADAVFASGAWAAVVYVMITTSAAAASPMEFTLVAYNQLDGVRMGLTALPNAAADAAGGLPISDAGGLDLDAKIGALTYSTANRVDAQVLGIANDAITANSVANGAIDAATFAAGAIDATAIAANAIGASELAADAVDEILDEVVEGTLTLRQAIRVIVSACAGKLSGAATTTVVIRDTTDNKDRVTATVDADGNRSAVTLDVS